MPTKIKNLSINIGIMILSTIITIILIEVIITAFFQQRILKTSVPEASYINYDSEIGWVNKKNVTGYHKYLRSEKPIQVRTNEFGLRGGPISLNKPEGVTRILILGDSNAFGFRLQEEEIFSTLISKYLPGNYQVLNSGVFGYGTDQAFLLLARERIKLQPDIVILAFSAGDASDNMNSINTGSSKPYFKFVNGRLILKNIPVPHSSIYRKSESSNSVIKNTLYNYSNLYRLLFNRLIATNIFAPQSVQEMSMEEGMDVTIAIVSLLNEFCRQNNCQPVVLFISHGQLVAAQSQMNGMEIGYFPQLKKSFSELGIPYIDPTEELVNQYRLGKEVFLENDPVHINALGNEIVAKAAYKWISDNFLKNGN